ncbi:redoxin domain-containing protein [Rubrobacter indicoceani]|nr:redoxin domain-containing protein [Rubrobacter indicoceani]
MSENEGRLTEGQTLSNFKLPDENGEPFELYGRLREKPLVLVFYRGDW